MQKIVVALAGQPNVGKSSLINAISNAKLKVGNFSGVTVEKKEVIYKLCDEKSCMDYDVHIIDLPGAYSLNEYTIEEKVTNSFLKSSEYDIIVNVIDSTNLQRNLVFTSQLLETGKKVIVALNMIDEAEKEGIHIDEQQLSLILGVPCIKVSSKTKEGIEELKEMIVATSNQEYKMPKIIYSDVVEEEISNIVNFLEEKKYKTKTPYRLVAIKLLQEDEEKYKKFYDEPIWIELLPIVREALGHIYLHNDTKNLKEIFSNEHFAFAKGAKMEVMSIEGMKAKNITQKIDNLLISPYLGLPIFLLLMWGLFNITFEIGSIPMDAIDSFFVW
ncbi:MAG: ferrous iron transporter B, partial [Epsilonproteobacteria bacterium]|nr:ferrous iron transporter B [Campylobacterota bacterium]